MHRKHGLELKEVTKTALHFMPFPPGQEQRWSKEFAHARASGSMWVKYSPRGCLWCLGSFLLCQPVSGWGRGWGAAQTLWSWRPRCLVAFAVRRKSRGSSVYRSAKPRPAPSQHPALAIVPAASRSLFSPQGTHCSSQNTHPSILLSSSWKSFS